MEEFYHFKTNTIDVKFHKDPTDIDKYIVCTCARGENDYIEEIIQLSTDMFYIISNLYTVENLHGIRYELAA